jgi:hypothetical protein
MNKPSNPVRYSVKTRYGVREYASKREALRAAQLERADGWPSRVRDMRTGDPVER